MLKRLLSLFLIFLIIVLPFSITVHASSVEPIGWILELLQTAYSIESKRAEVAEMSPDEFYEFMVNDNSFDTLLWKSLVDTMAGPFSFTIDNAVDDMKAAKYNAGKVHKDQLALIYEQATKINTSNLRFYSFEDLGLSSYSEFKSTITYSGYNCIPHLGKEYDENLLDGVYTRADDDSYIQYYNGSSMAFPVIWVPSNCVLYQNGVALPTMAWIIPLGYNSCIVVGEDKHTLRVFTTNSGETIYDLRIGFNYDNNVNYYPWVHEDGKGVGMVNTGDNLAGWVIADLLSKMVGYCISTGNDNAGQFTVPSDVPYDDDGYVYVCVPEDHSDIIYLSPTTYNEYIDNGTIVENEYVSNVTDETVNNITNNITNIYEGSSYDDTNLLNKLEGWFSNISNKLDEILNKLSVKIEAISPDDIISTIGTVLNFDNFDKSKFELDWKTLVQTKLPILNEIQYLVHSLADTNSPLLLEAENPMNWLLGKVPDEERKPNFVVDFAWYSEIEYKGLTAREYVRKGLTIIVYVAFFASMYRKTDVIFRDL